MPNIPKIRKAKRVSVLTKRAQCLGKHYKERSYRPLYEKLKNNNNFLAKALTKEKQTNQSLFTQNVQLIAEIQQLNVICNTRNTVIDNVLNNSKEMLKILINMTGYITSTISICQEVAASNTTVRLSSASDGRKKSSNRLSTKSPAKGVVKPMVGGHTITKPTINLSRVNMESISRLSDIQEVITPDRNEEISENRPSLTVSLPSTPLRYENNRTICRMPERLIASPRVSDVLITDEQRRRRRNYSNRISGSYSRSRNIWSDETPTTSTRHINIASPTIQLKDISNLLRDSQTVNIRRIIDNRVDDIENQENNNESNNSLERNSIIPETHMSINPNNENKMHTQISKKDLTVKVNKVSDKKLNKISNVIENSRLSQNNTRNWEEEDPLEGPSWLFNNTIPSRDNEPEELNHLNVSDVNNNTSQLIVYDDDSNESNTEELSPLQSLNESVNDILTLNRNATSADRIDHKSHDEDDSDVCELPTRNIFNRKENLNNIEDNNAEDTTNFTRFVTLRREHPEVTEDFTLMLSRQPIQNMQFDINELRLPNLEESMMNSIGNEINTEVTVASPNIVNISAMSNNTPNDLERNQTATIKLPLSSIKDEKESTPQQKKYLNKNNKIAKLNFENETNYVASKDKTKKRNKSRNNRDPSTAKVVLEKLNESHVKLRTPPVDDIESRNTNDHVRDTSDKNLEQDEIQDSENNMSNNYTSGRPRRRKAPVNLREPNLQKKIRRN
ncbi:putative uncharacterized protein DDB_G0277255 [Camponotus floridanus]|uniref:putative uncharacterized protein DDB_G0277255 n=1 Tax=Camponotus floridanus TaxID=104421 RepID=UPI00059CDAB1|nr:putative uncharacterized protein DDB_G0277255 [Camponotus floridanus]